MPDSRRNTSLDLMQFSYLGVTLGLSIGLFCLGGHRLDLWLDTSPVLLIIGAFVGLGGGMWHAVRQVDRFTRASKRHEGSPDDESP